MNTKTQLKLFAGEVISESRLDKDTKIQLLNYVKEADTYEVMALLVDGKIQNISKQAKPIVFERFKRSPVSENFTQFVQEQNPLQTFIKQVKGAPDGIKKAADGFLSDVGAGVVDTFPGVGMISKAFSKSPPKTALQKVQDKVGGILDWIGKKINIGDVSDKFSQGVEQLKTLATTNPAALSAGVALALIAAVSYGIVSRKKGDKQAKKEVQKSLNNTKKLDKDKKKAAEAVAKAYK